LFVSIMSHRIENIETGYEAFKHEYVARANNCRW